MMQIASSPQIVRVVVVLLIFLLPQIMRYLQKRQKAQQSAPRPAAAPGSVIFREPARDAFTRPPNDAFNQGSRAAVWSAPSASGARVTKPMVLTRFRTSSPESQTPMPPSSLRSEASFVPTLLLLALVAAIGALIYSALAR
jgi:hypothetical protein